MTGRSSLSEKGKSGLFPLRVPHRFVILCQDQAETVRAAKIVDSIHEGDPASCGSSSDDSWGCIR
jgi:hypothetical protein